MKKNVNYEKLVRFDMRKKPLRQRWYLRPVTWLLTYPTVIARRLRIHKVGMEGVKPPYLLLCTHHAFNDFKVTTAAIFPHRANYVVAIDGFIGRERLLRQAGGICKRKFTNDIQLVKHIRHVVSKQKDILALYPEARYSLIGTNAVLPLSLGKMAKLMKVPVVVLNMHGNYLNSPCWNLHERKNRISADMTLLFTEKDLAKSSVETINKKITEAFEYDEYRWQKDNHIHIDYPKRCEGLHKVLYMCPHCLSEYTITSKNDRLYCTHCHKSWQMDTLGQLHTVDPAEDESELITEFSHVPDWYEAERAQVRKEIDENRYALSVAVHVESLPNAKRFIPLGKALLVHDTSGFHLTGTFDGEEFYLHKEVSSMYSCHIEYDYKKKGDCIELSTLDDTYYIYPQGESFSVTKIALATEELFFAQKEQSFNEKTHRFQRTE
ncbi:MAG: hypothetical protein PQJ47_09620 [Sphaerochaetaceae bacterium]|nr:hypothetical protein [Sphaerochaetaceae bacterium]MDC7246983.1 hypothetical protein [Sphaerochaetaceae bacterium]